MRKRGKVDKSQPELVKRIRNSGEYVLVMSSLGNGAPDLAVRMDRPCPHCKRKFKQTVLAELKEVGGKLTPAEERWHDSNPGWATIWVVARQGNQMLVLENGKLLQFNVGGGK